MMKRLLAAPRRVLTIGALAAVAVVVAAGYGYAAITADNQTYTGCLQNGELTNVAIGADPFKACGKNATKISWSQTGPQGLPGTNGTNGTNGTDGVSVTSAAEAAGANCASGGSKFTAANGVTYTCNGAKGDKGEQGIQGEKGDPGVTTPPTQTTYAKRTVVTVPAGIKHGAVVQCDTGDLLTGGGFENFTAPHLAGFPAHMTIVQNSTLQLQPPSDGWIVQAMNTDDIPHDLAVVAICLHTTP
jgi:hypothetical protein